MWNHGSIVRLRCVGTFLVFLLDEISTGLDSSATYDIVSVFRTLARIRRYTCLFSLLQPSPEVFNLFDRYYAYQVNIFNISILGTHNFYNTSSFCLNARIIVTKCCLLNLWVCKALQVFHFLSCCNLKKLLFAVPFQLFQFLDSLKTFAPSSAG